MPPSPPFHLLSPELIIGCHHKLTILSIWGNVLLQMARDDGVRGKAQVMQCISLRNLSNLFHKPFPYSPFTFLTSLQKQQKFLSLVCARQFRDHLWFFKYACGIPLSILGRSSVYSKHNSPPRESLADKMSLSSYTYVFY